LLEHVEDPASVFSEVGRVLRPGGTFVIVTPNKWDYVSLFSAAIPDAWHPWLVGRLTGQREHKTVPTLYRANTLGTLRRLSADAGLRVEALELCRLHPHYLRKSAVLYSLGVLFELCVQKPVPMLRPMILGTFRL
jgi:SAM-dependent methyltransferase